MRATRSRYCRLVCLPPYSPEFTSIDQWWSKLKTFFRAVARTKQALENALAAVIDHLTAADARSCFAHSGYATRPN